MWRCKRCGKCCRFIIIPVGEPVDLDTEAYLEAHGIVYDGEKIIVPARCQYLKMRYKGEDGNFVYECMIHEDKFVNCRLGGEKECANAQKAWEMLVSANAEDTKHEKN